MNFVARDFKRANRPLTYDCRVGSEAVVTLDNIFIKAPQTSLEVGWVSQTFA